MTRLVNPYRFGAGGAALEQASLQALDHLTEQTPWDDTVTVPSGSNRLALVFHAIESAATHTSTIINPGGSQAAFTVQDTLNGVTQLYDGYLLESSMPAAGNYTLRTAWSVIQLGARQVIMLRNAAQTVPARGENSASNTTVLTVSVTRGTGSFPAGSKVYAAFWDGDGTKTYTVTGDATEVRDVEIAVGWGRFVFAAGTLTTAMVTADVTFTASATVNRLVGTIFVVEQAAGGGGGGVVSELSSNIFDFGFSDPMDAAVTVPSGSNRIMLDLIGLTLAGVTVNSWSLDPASANEALAQFAGSPVDSQTADEGVFAGFLVESEIAAVGNGAKILRFDPSAGRRGGRQVIFLGGAEQATPASATGIAGAGNPNPLTITLTGTFPAGTYLVAVMYGSDDGTADFIVTGNVTEVRDDNIATDNDTFVVASAILGSQVVNPSVTFTRVGGQTTNKAGFLIGVKPV